MYTNSTCGVVRTLQTLQIVFSSFMKIMAKGDRFMVIDIRDALTRPNTSPVPRVLSPLVQGKVYKYTGLSFVFGIASAHTPSPVGESDSADQTKKGEVHLSRWASRVGFQSRDQF